MNNLQERKLQLENLITSLQEELTLVNEQLNKEEVVVVAEIELNTRRAVILELGFEDVTEWLLDQVNNAPKGMDKLKGFIERMDYFGAYKKGEKIIFNTPYGYNLKYNVDAVKKSTGLNLGAFNDELRADKDIWNTWVNLCQYKDGGEK